MNTALAAALTIAVATITPAIAQGITSKAAMEAIAVSPRRQDRFVPPCLSRSH